MMTFSSAGKTFLLFFFVVVSTRPLLAEEKPSLETFAAPPSISDVSISPDGRHIALVLRQDDALGIVIRELDTGSFTPIVRGGESKLREVDWANDDTLLFWVSETRTDRRFRTSLIEFGAAFAVSIDERKPVQLMKNGTGLAVNSSTGNVVSTIAGDPDAVLMAARGESRDGDIYNGSIHSTFDVNLKTGRAKQRILGSTSTKRFFVDEEGELVARIDHIENANVWRLFRYDDRNAELIYEVRDSPLYPLDVYGFTPDRQSLVISPSEGDTDAIRQISLADGTISDRVFSKSGASISQVLVNHHSDLVHGVGYFDYFGPEYHFLNSALKATYDAAVAQLSEVRPLLVSWSNDFNRIVLYTNSGVSSGRYYIFDKTQDKFISAMDERSNIPAARIAETFRIEYKARDGMQITGVLTAPVGRPLEKAPAIIMPHGGPAAADDGGWDFMAQFFANEGYAVLQPNFRGSSGFGPDFEFAGYGQWGRGAMQHDITDGVQKLIDNGMFDPERICIVGASYGGYAALAGAAFTPDLYKCAAAIAPVSDLKRMLRDEKRQMGRSSWVVAYWESLISGEDADTKLDEISPARFAQDVKAPVLLLHGEDDTVVPIAQSRIMEDALSDLGKDVRFVVLKDEDHWLSNDEARIQLLREVDGFVKKHIDAGMD